MFDRADSAGEHQKILEALERGDRALVVRLLSQHIQGVRERVENFFLTGPHSGDGEGMYP